MALGVVPAASAAVLGTYTHNDGAAKDVPNGSDLLRRYVVRLDQNAALSDTGLIMTAMGGLVLLRRRQPDPSAV